MDTEFLKTFLEVYRTRHFGRAAENLFISQSAVSARIRLLEEALGVPVFTRKRNDIQLTPAGQRLLKHAESITLAWNRVRQEVALGEEGPELLTVGAVSSLWDSVLQDWTQWIYEEQPELALALEVHRGDTLVRRLLEGGLDMGFVFDAPQLPELVAEHVCDISLILVSTRAQQTPAQAMQQQYILVDWGTAFAISHAQQFPNLPTPRIRVEQGRMALALLRASGGAAYLAKPMVQQLLQRGELFRVTDAPVIERSAYTLFNPSSDRARVFEQVLTYFRQSSQT